MSISKEVQWLEVERLVPDAGPLSVGDIKPLMASLRNHCTTVFSGAALDFLHDLSRRIFADPGGKNDSGLSSLGFWLRRSNLKRLVDEAQVLHPEGTFPAPRGVVFHVPPKNVDTMFVFSWAVAVLTGNANVIRLSPDRDTSQDTLLRLIRETLLDHPRIAANTCILSYGHEERVTAAISSDADVRILWGGDQTIDAIRSVKGKIDGKDIAFRDRYSFAAFGAAEFLAADLDVQVEMVERFFLDAYTFDQAGCSSPRMIVWCGDEAVCKEATERFYPLLLEVIRERGGTMSPTTGIAKMSYACEQAIDGLDFTTEVHGNDLMVLHAHHLVNRNHCGGGVFINLCTPHLRDAVDWLHEQDQTLIHWGISAETLEEFIRASSVHGIDRVVPVGTALDFEPIWDGYPLLTELTRWKVLHK